jgi:hypothetical protein
MNKYRFVPTDALLLLKALNIFNNSSAFVIWTCTCLMVMHGVNNIKFANTKQAKQIHVCNNIRTKLPQRMQLFGIVRYVDSCSEHFQ